VAENEATFFGVKVRLRELALREMPLLEVRKEGCRGGGDCEPPAVSEKQATA